MNYPELLEADKLRSENERLTAINDELRAGAGRLVDQVGRLLKMWATMADERDALKADNTALRITNDDWCSRLNQAGAEKDEAVSQVKDELLAKVVELERVTRERDKAREDAKYRNCTTPEELERMGRGMRHSYRMVECSVCQAASCRLYSVAHELDAAATSLECAKKGNAELEAAIALKEQELEQARKAEAEMRAAIFSAKERIGTAICALCPWVEQTATILREVRDNLRDAFHGSSSDVYVPRSEVERAREAGEEWLDLAEDAWGIIANANGGDWPRSGDWREAAERWRDRYHAAIRALGEKKAGG